MDGLTGSQTKTANGRLAVIIRFWKAKLLNDRHLMSPATDAMVEQTVAALEELQEITVGILRGQCSEAAAATYVAADMEKKSPEDITEDDIPCLNVLCKVVWYFWEMTPEELWQALGCKSIMEIAKSPWDCWLVIKDLKKPRGSPDTSL